MKVYKCDRCGQGMKQKTDATVRVEGMDHGISFHACDSCANHIKEVIKGETND